MSINKKTIKELFTTMQFILTTAFSLFTVAVFSQDTTYYTNAETKTTLKDSADFYWVNFKSKTDSNRSVMKKYWMNGQIAREYNYSDYKKGIFDGKRKEYNTDGFLLLEIDYKEDKMDGKVLTYWNNGKLKRNDIYKQDTLVEGKCYTAEGNDTIYFPYIVYPQFFGGVDSLKTYLKMNLRYPRGEGNEGTVYIMFTIDENGDVITPSVYRSISPELNAEALRVVRNMPKWIPGKFDGESKKFRYTLPVTFEIPD